ncbi:GAF domain-containing protein [Leptospira borgpetersenii serovar Hardjo-bovis]|uniref:Adenylate/guanylate cyclase catalytic domain protein n=1 Tax=Leptospira borgpetersenii serovar Hardjo-bovis str. Sponselee TaxID=1303729 RepID=M6C2N3_LEPBO|nr:adenylate/guanylate cyclase domain-containing protein [Leptospira borgpetersenii]ABJ79594.1 Adenylate/guanylate cyclase [Leptospira borgpetersenii serovar Hardjo-bovis str. L550]AMX58935.1 adenylate cyclase [Leptospira borgpetersenii serovar Hardjo]AMX62189.1 adenylate cyclase [Leptospira borgpetersenii serovar Hardjo]AMX65432.1 adenylate cyclase [Leptospira borgpetersenii serovar Hardjo]AMX68642.1 adenylate cyclase [Leptospira borgpetersenii serovar Hardjo]
MEQKDFNSFFENEFQLLSEVNEILDKKEPLDQEALLKELKKIGEAYESLLKQSSKLMKIGDSTQNRLIKTQTELQDSNQRLASSYQNLKQLSEIGQMITASLEPKIILTSVYENTKSMLSIDILAFGIIEEGKNEIKYKFNLIEGRYTPAPSVDSLTEENPSSFCYHNNQELITNDLEKDFPRYISTIQKHFGEKISSVVYLPLKVEERFIGILTIQSYNKNEFNENKLNILRTLANYVAIGVDNADAYKTLSKRNRELKDSLEEINMLNKGLEKERQKSESLLLNILPKSTAERLKAGESVIADYIKKSTVLFADIVGFSKLSTQIPTPNQLVEILNQIFTCFDDIASKYHLEKIKTIGDCYMLAGGIPIATEDHAEKIALAAIDMIQGLKHLQKSWKYEFNIRIGIHTGDVVAGVIGKNKFVYDLWGDSVNTASRMESHGEPGKIHCSEAVYESLKNIFTFEDRGIIEVKGKGPMRTFFLLDKK